MQRDDKKFTCHICRANGDDVVLGTIVSGELVVNLASVITVMSDKTNVVVTCKKCGNTKTWFAKTSAVLTIAFDMLAQRVATEIQKGN